MMLAPKVNQYNRRSGGCAQIALSFLLYHFFIVQMAKGGTDVFISFPVL